MTADAARGGAARGARGGRRRPPARARSTGRRRPSRPPRSHPLRPQNPYAVSKASGGPARPLLRRRARAARDPRPRVQPRRAGPGADLRDRQLRPPVRRGPRRPATTRSGSSPAAPTRGATSPTSATSCAPTALLAAHGEPGIFNVCSGVSRSARELVAALAEVAGVAVDHQVDPAKVRAHEVFEIRGAERPPARRHRLDPRDPARADPRGHARLVAPEINDS